MRRFALLGVVVLIAACGGGQTEVSEEVSQKALSVGHGLPRVIALNAYHSRQMMVQAVFHATALAGVAGTGRIVNTGTLSPGFGGFHYAPSPQDRLVIRLPNATHEFVVKESQGNLFVSTPAAFLLADHVMRYTHRIPDRAENEISVQNVRGRIEAKVTGWYVQGGQKYNIQLLAAGTSAAQRDFQGQEVKTDYALTGTIRGGGLEVSVDERHSFAMAAATSLRLPTTMRKTASRFTGTNNNTVRVGSDTYRWKGVEYVTDSMTSQAGGGGAGVSRAEGEVLRNGSAFGRYALDGGKVVLQTGGGTLALDSP